MCGIAGAVRLGDAQVVQQMTQGMAYRGPDDTGLWERGDVCLGHRRLSIIDLSAAGRQPMESDDGNLVVTFNGEIYNYRELRSQLEKKGHRFRTATDTETLLFAYREYGVSLVDYLEGMFAFALWDDSEGRLLLARDRLGVKPLFFHCANGGIAFASELKAMCRVPGLERRVNRRALRSALRFASNLESESMLQSIHKLLPGHLLMWRDGTCTVGRYWTHPEPAPKHWNETDLAEEIRGRLGRAVRAQMVSDAPLGAALSGGLDSSGIVALMTEHGATVDTFTVGHGEEDPDLQSARIVADHCRTQHHEILLESENVVDLLPSVLWHMEEPIGQMESIQMYANYREAARFVKVLLIGEGADECFAGYDRYKLFDPRLPLPIGLRKELYRRVYMYADTQPASWVGKAISRGLWGPLPGPVLSDPTPRAAEPDLGSAGCGRALELALSHDQRTYLHHLSLKRADAVGMAHSLELRVPFLEREVVELAAQIPARMLLHRGVEKHALRQALAPLLPAAIAERPKRPFQMHLNRGLVETLDLFCDRLLQPGAVRSRGFFDPVAVDRLRCGRPGRFAPAIAHKVWSYRVWSVVLCELWARMFLDRLPGDQPPLSLADVLAS